MQETEEKQTERRSLSTPCDRDMGTVKLTVGLEMLSEARQGEFDTAHSTLAKVLDNIVKNPEEAKYRQLRTSNAKIGALLATKGVRAILLGVGFVEAGEFLTLPAEAPTAPVQEGLDRLAAQAAARAQSAEVEKLAVMEQRKAQQDKENEERKRMRDGIADDAACRKEPGWKAKAAGVKGGRDITTASDIGASGNSGG